MAGDAHECSTGGVSTEDSCRLGLLHVDRLAESRDSRHWPRNMRVSGAQSHDWQRCRFWSSIHLWKEKGRRDIYTRHKACLSGFFASRDKKANAFPGQKQELDSEFAPLFFHITKQMERKRKWNEARARTLITTQKCHAVWTLLPSLLIIAAIRNIFSSILFGNKFLLSF